MATESSLRAGLEHAIGDLKAYGEDEKNKARIDRNRDPYEFYGGWVAALDRVADLLRAQPPELGECKGAGLHLWKHDQCEKCGITRRRLEAGRAQPPPAPDPQLCRCDHSVHSHYDHTDEGGTSCRIQFCECAAFISAVPPAVEGTRPPAGD